MSQHTEDSGLAQLMNRFADAVDRRQPEAVAAQFTAEGTFLPPNGSLLTGPAAIEAYYKPRLGTPGRKTNHQWTNLQTRSTGANSASLAANMTTYAFEPNLSESDLQVRIGKLTARCERDPQGVWRFADFLFEMSFATTLPLKKA